MHKNAAPTPQFLRSPLIPPVLAKIKHPLIIPRVITQQIILQDLIEPSPHLMKDDSGRKNLISDRNNGNNVTGYLESLISVRSRAQTMEQWNFHQRSKVERFGSADFH
ncbi:hypothetical protein Zmor_019602 [Zophobas morio]|uniref:Uncharacterized protein n=1 Tax=Zophobas morio TaxID=2755281 RepID=A0AA38I3X6_9CUCU|nr:hypothetical protein Zmor_019602 [Zophobas morio]